MNETLLNPSNTPANMEDLLNQTLDGVVAAPDFSNPPAGEYRLEVKNAVLKPPKEVGKNNSIVITYAVVVTYSVTEAEMPVPDGTMFSENFQYTDKGLPYFMARVIAVLNVEDVAGVPIREMLSSIKGQAFDAKITIKKTPNPKGGEYENVNIRVVPPAE